MAGSGLESGTLWLVMVPFTVSFLLAYPVNAHDRYM